MVRQLQFNPAKNEDLRFAKRVKYLSIGLSCLVLLLLTRLFYLQIVNHSYYQAQASKNQANLLAIEPSRGLIYDRNGVILADNVPVFSLVITRAQTPNLKKTLSQLQSLLGLSNHQVQLFLLDVKNHPRFAPIPLIDHLSQEQMAKFMIDQYRFTGVSVKTEFMRRYPLGDALAPVVGYVGRINTSELKTVDPANYSASTNIGKMGAERYFEQALHGHIGYLQVQMDANGHILKNLGALHPEVGTNFYLTIDSRLQQVAYKAFNGSRGALVAIDPNNGQVLALVSSPTFDPNLFVDGIDTKTFNKLQNNPDLPLVNRAVRGLFPFGSTIKPFYALAGLNSGVISPDYTIEDPGFFKLPNNDHIYHDWRRTGHGTVNVGKAIEESCDTFFFELSLKLGINRMIGVLHSFGFGEKTGIENREEISGLVPTPAWKLQAKKQGWYTGDTLAAGIGQGYLLTTPVELAQGVSLLAMQGHGFAPTLLLKQQASDGSWQEKAPIKKEAGTISREAWTTVIDGMRRVISVGTGSYHFGQAQFGKPLYPAAGKTGSAQVFNLHNKRYNKAIRKDLRDNSLFIVFAPIDHPKIAIAVVVEHEETAGIIARQVADYYLLHSPENPAAKTSDPTDTDLDDSSVSDSSVSDSSVDDSNDEDDATDSSDNNAIA